MSARIRPIVVFALVCVLLSAPEALACPVCLDAQEKNRGAFVLTTWLLTFLPLGMIGGLIWWLRRKVRQLERLEGSAAR